MATLQGPESSHWLEKAPAHRSVRCSYTSSIVLTDNCSLLILHYFCCRIHQAIKDNTEVVDVDGSYLYKKSKRLEDAGGLVAPLDPPSSPVTGWETVTEVNASDLAKNIPYVTSGVIYTYLSTHSGRESGEGTFRALTRGYTHWASGRIDRMEVNNQNPEYCHVRSNMKPSMKPGSYNVWILLGRVGHFATIQCATCECAAG